MIRLRHLFTFAIQNLIFLANIEIRYQLSLVDASKNPKSKEREAAFVKNAIEPVIRQLKSNKAAKECFAEFAISKGARVLLLPNSLNAVIRGQPPSAFMALVLMEYGQLAGIISSSKSTNSKE